MKMEERKVKVLAVSSGGGHWVQLLRLRPAFDGCDVTYATVGEGYKGDLDGGAFTVIADCNRSRKLKMIRCIATIAVTLLKVRPDVVVSTGAAPGYFAVRIGKWMGVRTIWVDSVANVDELSMSGQMAGRCADLWLTQWTHLERQTGPLFRGSVL